MLALSQALKHKATPQTTHDNLLGSIDNSGSSGCTGNKASNGGKCVVYKAGLTAAGADAVQWLKHLQTAAEAEEARHIALQGLESKAGKLEALNKTLDRLFLALRSSAAAGNPTPATAPETTKSSKANKEEAEKECNKAKDDKTECDKLKDKGCTFNDKAKKCTLSEAGKQAVQKAKENEGKEEKKEEKCTGKAEDACKKDTGCKWENNACKDYSFLVNKKLALMDTAFVSLITF
ncbi:Trypanosomal VSG domain/Trypanosome variant surface glycoprotein C-terminal domain containing protein, putative [Trypanosoma equiperdum]|uniref:Trypanosomal VSG domain/Trypanosome variant surface glycoprotein C-terminal domain containing protein, putative n=1 Tax=Trypanosoma equiperdum TaxID=5694 RepID=A0A1G4HZ30_TRYEQ|nr:Trypanosomal VSG domain/Trypanosome variant surface glycoprotein C-terminal domain containing protein, putative [Trypanosoma equiperdum]